MLHLPFGAQARDFSVLGCGVECWIVVYGLDRFLNVAPQHNVGSPASHVGGNGDHLGPAGLGNDVRFTGVLFRVQHLVGQVFAGQQLVDDFRVFNRRCTHQHRLAPLITFADVLDCCLVLFTRCLVHTVKLVFAFAGTVRRDHNGFKAVDFLEFVGFGVGCSGHA